MADRRYQDFDTRPPQNQVGQVTVPWASVLGGGVITEGVTEDQRPRILPPAIPVSGPLGAMAAVDRNAATTCGTAFVGLAQGPPFLS